MIRLMIWQIMGLCLVGQVSGPGGDPPAGDDAPAGGQAWEASPSVEVRIKQLDPAVIVYLEHRGPYWAMGKLFGQVAALMAERDQGGAMFARYLDDPAKTGVQALRAEVGFFADDDLVVGEPFGRKVLGGRWVASLTVEGRYGRSPTAQAKVRDWVRAQGWKADPALMEIYPAGPDRATEIQVTILEGGPVGRVVREPVKVDPESIPAKRLAGYRRMLQALPGPGSPQVRSVEECVAQLGWRISAIGLAAGRSYPDRAVVFEALSAALLERLDWQVAAAPGPVVEAGGAIRPQGAQGLEGAGFVDMIGQLDRLLVEVTLGRLGAEAALSRFADVTAWVPQAETAQYQAGE